MRLLYPRKPELVGSYAGYRVVRCGDVHYGVPERAYPLDDLEDPEECEQFGVLQGASRAELEERIDRVRRSVPVEFAGWLPAFELAGNCGRHPQFKHTAQPPPGYWFTRSALRAPDELSRWQQILDGLHAVLRLAGVGLCLLTRPLWEMVRGDAHAPLRGRFRVLAAMVRLFFTLWRGGGRLVPILLFLRTRHFQSQLLLAHHRGPVFLPSIPFTYNQNPWVIEIEDPTTLFYPFIHNGQTRKLRIARSPSFPIIKTLLESPECKGIITHMKSTAAMVGQMFGSETIRNKIHYTPLGVRLPERYQRHEPAGPDEPIHLLFTNSWHQLAGSFDLRGGLDVLEAFSVLRQRYPQLRLTLRTELPGLCPRHHRIIEEGWVRVIGRFLTPPEMEALFAESHIFLLPAARVHIVSVLQAMSYGLAVVTSDGWGFREYVTHERNGLVVRGRYGRVSWVDREEGMLREFYEPMHRPDARVVRGLVAAVSRLVEDLSLRQRLGRTARRDVETHYNLERWNAGLKQAFDRALSREPGSGPVETLPCLPR
jgi:glycosyltransferase involved in cell wall biosynthesis